MIGYWPACFPQKKLTTVESSILEKAFWKMIFGSENAVAVYGFLKTCFHKATNLNDYVKKDDDKDDSGDRYRDIMTAQFKWSLYNKCFSIKIRISAIISSKKLITFGLIMFLLMRDHQYQLSFMNMTITPLKWVFTFEDHGMIQSLENWKNSW